MIEKISAVTFRVANMEASIRFYKDVLGLEIIYGGEGSDFTSLRTKVGDTIHRQLGYKNFERFTRKIDSNSLLGLHMLI
jgi:catechol 2,3-dioxygenase-like lactoylglutathione lyase family enzyme